LGGPDARDREFGGDEEAVRDDGQQGADDAESHQALVPVLGGAVVVAAHVGCEAGARLDARCRQLTVIGCVKSTFSVECCGATIEWRWGADSIPRSVVKQSVSLPPCCATACSLELRRQPQEELLGPDELEGEHRESGRADEKSRPWQDEHHDADNEDGDAAGGEENPIEAAPLSMSSLPLVQASSERWLPLRVARHLLVGSGF
jgi:hypothetical protein